MKQLKRLLALLAFTAFSAHGALPETSVSYTTVGEPLYATVHTLEKTLGTKVVLRDVDPNQQIKGKYLAVNGKAFLEDFARRNRLAWAYQNNQVILAPEGTDLSPKKAVTDKGAAPASFSRVVFDPKDPNKYGLMIFQVHNASVDDRKVTGNKVIKGIATLFGEFIGAPVPQQQTGKPKDNSNVSVVPNQSAVQQNNLLGLFTKKVPLENNDETPAILNNQGSRGVYADSRLNAILVRDKVANFEAYKQIIALLDRPADMVQLEAFIVDVEKKKSDSLGLNLGLGSDDSGKLTTASNLILNPFSTRTLLSKIKALEGSGEAQSLSVPSVVSLNNEQALFSSRQNFYVSVAGGGVGGSGSVNQVTAETQLLVTPQIANESADVPYNQRRVKLLINVQDAQLDEQKNVGGLPRTAESQITTQAVIRSGDTLVIGGQIVRKRVKETQGLPGSTEAGFFGRFFSERTETEVDYVRIYIVRPLILGEDSASAREVTTEAPVTDVPNVKNDILQRAPFVTEINLFPTKQRK